MTPYAVVLAHHPIVDALPALIPMVVLVGAFGAVVVADRRRSRREGDAEPDRAATLGE